MFRCEACENYFDKSECEEHPTDEFALVCWECCEDIKEINKRKENGCWTPKRENCDCLGCGGSND